MATVSNIFLVAR
uniref:Uncharacterized protein n=1 Tax=Anguilla anguilla TaxID=7936 RepID=A0A0E9TDG5_ANGAN